MHGLAGLQSVVTYPVGAGLGQRIVIDGPRGTIFEYDASNNLVGSWASRAGTDPYGHAYLAGFSITGTYTGSNFIINSSGAFFYSGAPALGNLIASIAPAPGIDGLGNVYVQGLASYSPGSFYTQVNTGQIQFGSQNVNTRLNGTAGIAISDATTDGGSPGIFFNAPPVPGALAPFMQINTQSKDLSVPASAFIGGGLPANTVPLTVQGPVTAGPDGISQASFTADANGWPNTQSNVTGFLQGISGNQPAQLPGTVINTTGFQLLGANVSVKPTDLVNNAQYEYLLTGGFSTGTTPSSATFAWSVGGVNQATLAIPTITAGLTGAGWWLRITVTITSGGSTNNASCNILMEVGWHTGSGVSGSAYWFNDTVATGIDFSFSRNLNIRFAWGSVPGTTSLNVDTFTFGRRA